MVTSTRRIQAESVPLYRDFHDNRDNLPGEFY
jgi:hypothetical protein